MKYKVGDKVRIKSLSWFRNKSKYVTFDFEFWSEMAKYCGTTMTISRGDNSYYLMEEDLGEHLWKESMIECKVEE